ncbi:helix-turn-helix domain-containing protein [Autumnicola musiva]|uniref:Helix-turn-helix transcriptional regulator n=1 Tax=Autumnicola musiva TaxID=3075589 RepID=A0ABU3D787_9FLAO|nr:helix-turn-helix transcriptional regulator [Zunongwangia sp. F117]MDT0677301.1 helix-turn-helix transcriptional regulator [Zunongwangia sp. F117]
MIIGHKIETIRKLRGLSQAELGKSLGGISKQAVSKIEQRSSINEITLKNIAKILDITPEGLKRFDPETVILNMIEPVSKIEVIIDNSDNPMSNTMKDICFFYEKLLRSGKKIKP